MPELTFRVEGAEPVLFAASPQLVFKLRAGCTPAEQPVDTVLLRCCVRLEDDTLWAHTQALVPAFTGGAVVDLKVPCTFDFNVAAARFFPALEGGEAPLRLLLEGAVFSEDEEGRLRVAPVAGEVYYRMPARIWREMMEHYYPNQAWLKLRRELFDRLYAYKVAQGLPTWEQAVERLLDIRR